MTVYPAVRNAGSYINRWLWMWWWILRVPYGEEYCCWCRSGKSGNILWYLFLSLFSKSYRSWSCMAPPITLFYVICKILNISKYLLLVKNCTCFLGIKYEEWERKWKVAGWWKNNWTYDTFYNKCAKLRKKLIPPNIYSFGQTKNLSQFKISKFWWKFNFLYVFECYYFKYLIHKFTFFVRCFAYKYGKSGID